MKRNKIAILLTIAVTAVSLAACGKTEQEAAANAETETVLQESE